MVPYLSRDGTPTLRGGVRRVVLADRRGLVENPDGETSARRAS